MIICPGEKDSRQICIDAPAGMTYAQAIWLSPQVRTTSLCGGLGLCGNCAVRFLEHAPEPVPDEAAFFSPEELDAGWRLGCRHTVRDSEWPIKLQLRPGQLLAPAREQHDFRIAKGEAVSLGVDLGTTSIEWRALDGSGCFRGEGKLLNPQAGAGADVIARLAFARDKTRRSHLSALISNVLDSIILELRGKGLQTVRICIAGNSAMTEIFLDMDISGLCAAPYHLAFNGGRIIPLSLPCGEIPCIIPPLPAPFVGADLSAGLWAILHKNVTPPVLLADLGTNAELALLLPENELVLGSVPLGPALEGIGPRCGQAAAPGVAVGFALTPAGLAPQYLQGAAPCGISATGYLSLLARLLELGVMDRAGHFRQPECLQMPLARRIAANIRYQQTEPALALADSLSLASGDVELLLKVKAAFTVAINRILATAGLAMDEIAVFCLTGAIATYGNREDMARTGFIPRQLVSRTVFEYNLSLLGACELAQSPDGLAQLSALCSSASIVQLVDDPDFLKDYMAAMQWD